MRVIAGKYKGRKLRAPENYEIRPTSDKVKEALFSILTGDVYGAEVLDLFSGTGALGIEALSRGAAGCTFVDSSRAAVSLIRENLENCHAEEETRLRTGDVCKVLESLEGPFDIILADPPYNRGFPEKILTLIDENGLLAEDGVLVIEHSRREDLPEKTGALFREKKRRYGICELSVYIVAMTGMM